MLFYVWGHTFEFDKYESWDRFELFCKLIARKADLTYATNAEVFQYMTEN